MEPQDAWQLMLITVHNLIVCNKECHFEQSGCNRNTTDMHANTAFALKGKEQDRKTNKNRK